MHRQDEIETLYYQYSQDVYHYLLSMCRNPVVAEDLMQSTFLQVMKGIAGFRGNATIKTWIFTIARHEYFRYLRKDKDKDKSTQPLEETFPSDNNVEGDYERREQVRQILEYLNQLEEPYHSLMILRLINGFSFREIASILGKTEVWARVNFMRNKCKLIETLKEES